VTIHKISVRHETILPDDLISPVSAGGAAIAGFGPPLVTETSGPTLSSAFFSGYNNATSEIVKLTFNETVKAGSGNFVILNDADGSVYETIAASDTSRVTISGNTVFIDANPDYLTNHVYDIKVGTGAITDTAGNAYVPPTNPIVYTLRTDATTHIESGTQYAVASGQSVTVPYSTNHETEQAFNFDGPGKATDVTSFDNQGTVTIDLQTGLNDDTTGHTGNSVFWNELGADFEVTPPSPTQTGVVQGNPDTIGILGVELDFKNDGTFHVVGYATAEGVEEGFGAETASFTNTGTLSVEADGGAAHGYIGGYAGTFNNSGTITVSGTATDDSGLGTETYAVWVFHQNAAPSFTNSGTITATDVGGTSLGVAYSLDTSQPWTLTNSGTITADVAIEEFQNKSNQGPNSTLIDNSGTINGKMLLDLEQPSGNSDFFGEAGPITHTVDNDLHGVINGDIVFGRDNDVFSGAAGTMNGTIYGGGGNDTIIGGAGATMAGYDSAWSDHGIAYNAATDTFTVSDLRNNAPDGTDTVTGIHQFAFTDGTYTYNAQGQLAEKVLVTADGTIDTHFDAGGTEPWSQQSEHTDASGSLAEQVVVDDSGATWTNTYFIQSSSPWSWSTSETDASGNLVSLVTGIGAGVSTLTMYDNTNSAPWTSITIHFGADGSWNSVSEVNDDSSTTVNMGAVETAYDDAQWYATPYDTDLHGTAAAASILGGPEGELLYGHAGADTIDGGGGNDYIVGGAGNDTLTGGAGADRFAFGTTDGSDTITDFTPGTDQIQLDGLDNPSFAALQPLISQQGSDTLIALDPQNHILLKGVLPSQLHASDFVFH
jgi:hypothetical protein